MASILDRYGIKEVADVMFYEINDDTGAAGAPVLYLDTLKVSTIETTAENTSARGGKGNPELIMWDYGKEITITLEDALFSAKSMALMFGDDAASEAATTIRKTIRIENTTSIPTSFSAGGKTYAIPTTRSATTPSTTAGVLYNENGTAESNTTAALESTKTYYYTFLMDTKKACTIDISPETFPGTYYITGDTYARSEITGKDEFFQFVVPKAKVLSEVTLTMEAEGDPSTFSMNLKVLRPKTGSMMQLIKYDLNTAPAAEG